MSFFLMVTIRVFSFFQLFNRSKSSLSFPWNRRRRFSRPEWSLSNIQIHHQQHIIFHLPVGLLLHACRPVLRTGRVYTMQTLCIWFQLIVRNKDICTSFQKKTNKTKHVKQKVETNSLL